MKRVQDSKNMNDRILRTLQKKNRIITDILYITVEEKVKTVDNKQNKREKRTIQSVSE